MARELAGVEPKRRMTAGSHTSIRHQLENMSQRRIELVALRAKTQTAIAAMEQEFSRYRKGYRDQARAGAIGQSLGNLTIRGGREYRQAVITRVTGEGLEIRHENGLARLQAEDLAPALQERFQWNDEERRTGPAGKYRPAGRDGSH